MTIKTIHGTMTGNTFTVLLDIEKEQQMNSRLIRPIGKRVREVREEIGLSQREFARRLGIANSFICDIENGNSGPGFYFFYLAGKYLKISPMYLLFGTGPKLIDPEKPETLEQPKQQTSVPDDFGDDTPRIRQMLSVLKRSEVAKLAVLGFFSKFLVENKAVLDEEINPGSN